MSLNDNYFILSMTNIPNIQDILSIRKDLRDPRLPSTILTSIENIHNCIKGGTDLNGWKKVDWRNSKSNSRSDRPSDRPSDKPNDRPSDRPNDRPSDRPNDRPSDRRNDKPSDKPSDKPNSFGNRPNRTREYTASHFAFENKPKNQFTQPESKSIPLTSNTKSQTKYVSKFKKTSANVDDTILNTILLGKLNKFSQQNYGDIKEFITHIIDDGETDMIKCFMKLVFEKAASEEIFCPLYAKLLSELSTGYPILLTEMDNLYSHYMTIFDEVSEDSTISTENYNEFCTRNIGNKYRRGYSQFLAELIKYDVIELEIFVKTIDKIITRIENNCNNKELIKLNEEFADCLMKIVKAIKTDEKNNAKNTKIKQIRNVLMTTTMLRIKSRTLNNSENMGMSNKARFTMLDMYDIIQKF